MTADAWTDIDIPRLRAARRLCLFAHYHQDAIVAEHVVRYLEALGRAGFTILVLSTSPLSAQHCARLRDTGAVVILRGNHGMDFGGWIEACMRLFPITAELLLLANDSVYAPLGDLPAFVERLIETEADFYGALESLEVAPHLQSWFVLLRPAAYESGAFAELMRRPMPEMGSKLALVLRYEIGLTQDLVKAGLRYHTAFTLAGRRGIATALPYNPARLLWRQLIEAGIPFLKVEAVRVNPMRAMDIADWREVVARSAPAMLAPIERDIAERGTMPTPGMLLMSRSRAIYWPEIRALVHADYRRGGGWLTLAPAIGLIAIAWLPRWAAARAIGVRMKLQARFGRG